MSQSPYVVMDRTGQIWVQPLLPEPEPEPEPEDETGTRLRLNEIWPRCACGTRLRGQQQRYCSRTCQQLMYRARYDLRKYWEQHAPQL